MAGLPTRSPSSVTPFPDGRSLMLGPDKALTHREISKFSPRDAEALPKYEAMGDAYDRQTRHGRTQGAWLTD